MVSGPPHPTAGVNYHLTTNEGLFILPSSQLVTRLQVFFDTDKISCRTDTSLSSRFRPTALKRRRRSQPNQVGCTLCTQSHGMGTSDTTGYIESVLPCPLGRPSRKRPAITVAKRRKVKRPCERQGSIHEKVGQPSVVVRCWRGSVFCHICTRVNVGGCDSMA